MKSRQQSVGKEDPAYVDNEDANRADDAAGVWAVADGAGGTGLYASEWAQHLVGLVGDKPLGQLAELTRWLDGHWEGFYTTHQSRAQADYLTEYKFMHEGSGATLTTLHERASRMHWSAYGDAVALCYQPATRELQASQPDVRQFQESPDLLNWLAVPRPDGFRAGVWVHQPGQQYALLSDTLGQYVLMAYAALEGEADLLRTLGQQPTALGSRAQAHLAYWTGQEVSFRESVWEPLRTALASPETFLRYTGQLRMQQLLGIDDYTCIFIED